jgi:heme exporter protein B
VNRPTLAREIDAPDVDRATTAIAGGVSAAAVTTADFDAIDFRGICYDYGRRRVLSRVSLSASAGTITGILGPNGAGKSTLLSIASTRARPSQGEVRYGALPPSTPGTALRAQIGWLGHDPGFYPELTAGENLTFYARLHGVSAVAAVVTEALAHAGLSDRRDDPVGGFSRGMRQRLGLERVLLHGPRLVLLDEPFTGLDDASARALLQRLAQLRGDHRIVLLSTHDLDFVSGLLDRAAVLRNGRIVDEFDVSSSAGAGGLVDRYRRAVAPVDTSVPAATAPSLGTGTVAAATSNDVRAQTSRPVHSLSPARGRGQGEGEGSDAVEDARVEHRAPDESLSSEIGRFVRAARLIMWKDLVVEFRSRELLLTTLFFAVSCVLVFSFALVKQGQPMEDAAAGILWIAISFAGTLALGRTFEREQAHQTLQALLQAPIERAAIYAGKLLGLLALLLIVEAVVVPLVALFFQAALITMAVHVAGLVFAGTMGLLAVGTLFSAMLVRTRSRDVLLPVLLYPMTVPALIAGVRGTAALIQETPDWASARAWMAMLLFFNAVFLTLALWTFDAVTSD